jgi:eukaryotic-like serine/threonine-protein kinase
VTPEDWQRAKEILEAALARPTHERSQYVADRCVGDDVLRQEIQSLLTACNVAHPRDGHWWEFPS